MILVSPTLPLFPYLGNRSNSKQAKANTFKLEPCQDEPALCDPTRSCCSFFINSYGINSSKNRSNEGIALNFAKETISGAKKDIQYSRRQSHRCIADEGQKTITILATATRLKLFGTYLTVKMKLAKRHCPTALYHQLAPTRATDGLMQTVDDA